MGHKMLKIALRDKLTTEDLEHISKSFDIVGNIAVVRVSPELFAETLNLYCAESEILVHAKFVIEKLK